jgi:nucleoside-diphosphate-sugar epimerase
VRVTGARGFIGRHVVAVLTVAGHKVASAMRLGLPPSLTPRDYPVIFAIVHLANVAFEHRGLRKQNMGA